MVREEDANRKPPLTRRKGPALGVVRTVGQTPLGSGLAVGMFYDGRLAAVGYPQVAGASHPRGGVLEASTLPPVALSSIWLQPMDENLRRESGPMLSRAEKVARAGEIAERGEYAFDLLHIAAEEFPKWKVLIATIGPVVVFEAELVLRIRHG